MPENIKPTEHLTIKAQGLWRYRLIVPLITGFLVLFALMLFFGGAREQVFSTPWIVGWGTGIGILLTAWIISLLSRRVFEWVEIAEGEIRIKIMWSHRIRKYPLTSLKKVDMQVIRDCGLTVLVFADGTRIKLSSGEFAYLETFSQALSELVK